MTKHIFITGGVVSSLGKGITAASVAFLLKRRGYKIRIQKLDPYINVDPGTMSPFQHGEVYVTDDGAETDLDLGYYERFTSATFSKINSVSTGQVYYSVIQRERRGDYLGRTVQVIPHITNEIKERIWLVAKESKADFIIVEIGGTVGDIESVPFLEAIRQFKHDYANTVMYTHLTLVPTITVAGEAKTKPTQHSVKELSSIGIQPDVLVCRVAEKLTSEMKSKISMFTNVPEDNVISAIDINTTIYEIPLMYEEEGLDRSVIKHFNLTTEKVNMSKWKRIVKSIVEPDFEITIGVAGKYISLQDAYRSIYEALTHGGIPNNCKVNIKKINSDQVGPANIKKIMEDVDGILIPGGFGERGVEGKITTIKYARENKIPFLGICLGMQTAVIEFARNIMGWKNANSSEFNPESEYPVISLLVEQQGLTQMGGTQRLGSYTCGIEKNTLSHELYKKTEITERHRHRFEFTHTYYDDFVKAGLTISGINSESGLVEIVEIKDHPFFLGCQFHPEFKSKPTKPHPLFSGLVKAALQKKDGVKTTASTIKKAKVKDKSIEKNKI